ATSAAMGVLTPQPCIPVITGPWAPGSTELRMGGVPVLTSNSMCTCAWGGSISIVAAGQAKVTG
ncbi:MAG: PAAR-like protein, partial [Actinomycetota bacterium]